MPETPAEMAWQKKLVYIFVFVYVLLFYHFGPTSDPLYSLLLNFVTVCPCWEVIWGYVVFCVCEKKHSIRHPVVHLKKEANWLDIWRKRWISCQFEKSVDKPPSKKEKEGRLSGGVRMEDGGWRGSILTFLCLNPPSSILHPHPENPSTSFSLSLCFLFLRERGWVNNHGRLIDSFFKLQANFPFFLIYSNFAFFSQLYNEVSIFCVIYVICVYFFVALLLVPMYFSHVCLTAW